VFVSLEAAEILGGFIDPSLFDDEVVGVAPEYILKEKVRSPSRHSSTLTRPFNKGTSCTRRGVSGRDVGIPTQFLAKNPIPLSVFAWRAS